MVIAHGQKTRWLKDSMKPNWRYAWQVVVDPGTPQNQGERLAERYTWQYNKYELLANEVAPVGACIITFDFKPVPKHAGGGGHDNLLMAEEIGGAVQSVQEIVALQKLHIINK